MTNNEIQYQAGAKRSKALCLSLEQLTGEAKSLNQKGLIYEHAIIVNEIADVKFKLNAIWDAQIELYYQIQYEQRFAAMAPTIKKIRAKRTRKNKLIN